MMVTVNGRGSRRSMTIIDMINDPSLFGPWFKNRKSWSAWLVFLSALFGLPMTPEQVKLYQECTARSEPPIAAAREGYLIVGRRGGKSLMLALLAVYIAAFVDHRRHLAPGRACHDHDYRKGQATGSQYHAVHPQHADADRDASAYDPA